MLRIAIQTKGRLNEESVNLLRESDINIDENKRKLLLPAKNFPIELLYLRDDDIPEAVATGVADLGIVGLNELEERQQGGYCKEVGIWQLQNLHCSAKGYGV